MLCLVSILSETNGSETKGLVIRNKIEHSFEEHLGKSARKNAVVANYILHQRKPRCLWIILPHFMEKSRKLQYIILRLLF